MGIIGASRSRVFYETNPRPRTDNPIPHHRRRINRLSDATVTDIVKLLDDNPHCGGCPIFCVRGLGLQVVRESVGVSHG